MERKRTGLMFVLSSPSGAGKTTLSRMLLEKEQKADAAHPGLAMSVSVTTRPRRPAEEHGRDYFFVDKARYRQLVKENALLEHAQVFEYEYGTPAAFVQDHLDRGVDVLFDIDWQGTRQLIASARAHVVSIFILPPSLKELERRLRARAQDAEEVVQKRMAKAAAEISHWQEYDYVLVNEDLEETLSAIETILKAERLKRIRQPWIDGFVQQLYG